MENSETQKQVISLGKMLIEEINLDLENDTLSLWMAHYIAEQITTVENTTGGERVEAEKRCFDTILKLWQHRAFYPRGQRPFDDFEPIFRALARLDPESPASYFFAEPNFRSENAESSNKDNGIQEWLDIAKGIDKTARIFIEYAFQQATLNATDEKTFNWIKNTLNLLRNDDISIIVHLIGTDQEEENDESAEQEQRAKQEKIKSRIEQLDVFADFSKMLRVEFETKLENMLENNSPIDEKHDFSSSS
jgi:hypothetical protein